MTRWLALREPEASPVLQLACRAQHFRRWEIPRSSYPMTRPGYLTWRAKLKSQAAKQVAELLADASIQPPLSQEEIDRVAALVRKEDLKTDSDTQVLEDVACLVFLDEQFDDFEKRPDIDEEKMVGILRKTWGKMSPSETTITPPHNLPSQKPPLHTLLSTHDFAHAASLTFPPKTHAFVTSAATDLVTHRSNSHTYSLITLRPRILRDVSSVSIHTTILGEPVSSPIFAAATSLGITVHPEGEKEIGRACKKLGVGMTVSTSASFSVGEIADAVRDCEVEGDAVQKEIPLWFQLYVGKDRSKSEGLLKQAVEAGVKAVFLTVDAPVPGKREADERISASEAGAVVGVVPMTGEKAENDKSGGGLGKITDKFLDASINWGDIPWLRTCLPESVKLVLKGVQTAADAVKAMEAGVEGIVVSNHGGRSLDTATPTVLVLLELQRCCPEVFDRIEVLIDGGVMRGTDVFKALCLGVSGVGIGRGILYGLGYGEEGVRRYVEILNDELETTMKMCEITSLHQVHPGLLNTRAVDHLVPETVDEEHPYAKWRPSMRKKTV
ncbi:cytochrome b2 [Pseudoneurospora amorphoporcata]|uniref:Cytochrome b2 n=1 Tax=Pseudoneurospora amorphoporcata TaxID=241081 RepID=A0AAN6SJZ0_9PEZI|nr:cytochrome b2 [Pseudoneurospora amorphoporcata]